MAFSYSGDPSSSTLDAVRFQLGDTSPVQPLLQDEEINYLIDTSGSEKQLLARVYRTAATAMGIRAIKRTLGPQSEDPTQRLKYFSEMADRLEKDLAYAGVPPLPDYSYEKVFDKHMMANDS